MSGQYLEVPSSVTDDYTAAIELSNACREFYRNRVKATEHFKQNINGNRPEARCSSRRHNTIDDAMDKLKSEMASLMDQDLSLMKQLLTLNEAIEDLKVKRLYPMSKDSLRASSQDLHASDWSVSETDMYDTEDEGFNGTKTRKDLKELHSSTPGSQEQTFVECVHTTVDKSADISITSKGTVLQVYHGQQNSIDSGYGDDDNYSAKLLSVSRGLDTRV